MLVQHVLFGDLCIATWPLSGGIFLKEEFMSQSLEKTVNVKWLNIFEGVAILLIAAAVIGIGSVFVNTQATNTTLAQLVSRFDRLETNIDSRFIRLENRVSKLERDK